MKYALACLFVLLSMTACTSHIVPLRPVERVEVWVPDEPPATVPGTQPDITTQVAETGPATRPGRMVVKIIDPNQTSRFIYDAGYDNVWQQAILIIRKAGFEVDRQDYRLGILITRALPSSQILEFWKPHGNAHNAMENTLNNQRRTVRLNVVRVPDKPEFYEIGIQVVVERQTNPSEEIGGPLFIEGSGFGRNAVTLRSDFATPQVEPSRWAIIGHDPDLEKKLLDVLFERI